MQFFLHFFHIDLVLRHLLLHLFHGNIDLVPNFLEVYIRKMLQVFHCLIQFIQFFVEVFFVFFVLGPGRFLGGRGGILVSLHGSF